MVTSRDVTARVAEILPDWPVSDLRTRERWLIQAGVVPKGKAGRGGVGLAPVSLRQALLYVLSLGAPKAVDGPKFVRRAAGSQVMKGGLMRVDAKPLIDYLESEANRRVAGERSDLRTLELACWDGKMFGAIAAIRGMSEKVWWIMEFSDNSDMKRQRKAYLKKMAGKKAPKRKPLRHLPADTPIKRVRNTTPLAMRWVRIDSAVILGVAGLFAEKES